MTKEEKEEMKKHGKEEIFFDYILSNAQNESFVSKYINSGLADNANFGGKLTTCIFQKYFYVKSNLTIEDEYNHKIDSLFRDSQRGVLGIHSHGGSGKTTFIEMIGTRLQPGEQMYKTIIRFVQNGNGYNEAMNRVFQVIRKKFLPRMVDPKNSAIYYTTFKNNLKIISNSLNSLKLANSDTGCDYDIIFHIWEKVCQILDYNFKEVVENDVSNPLSRILSLKGIAEIFGNSIDKQTYGLTISILLLTIAILSDPLVFYDNSKNKYMVVFDNIEALTSSAIGDDIAYNWGIIKNIFENVDIESLRSNFSSKLIFIICARTTTDILHSVHIDDFWGDSNEYIVKLESNDFCAEALLKKLKYLYDNKLAKTVLFKNNLLLCQLICGVDVVEKYLQGQSLEADYKIFAKNYLSPFFGNNFRRLVSCACKCIRDSKGSKRINELINYNLNSKDYLTESKKQLFYDVSLNGARNILWNLIFKSFTNDEVFGYFGIDKIDEPKESHSLTRILLTYMYWHKVKFIITNRTSFGYIGISLENIVNVFVNFYNQAQIVQTLYKLSNLHINGDNDKLNNLNSWSYLLDIKSKKNISNDLSEGNVPSDAKEIRIELSYAGNCYVHYVSSHFDFYSSRAVGCCFDNSLITFNGTETTTQGKKAYLDCIERNFERINNYIAGMLNNCKAGCKLYNSINFECYFQKAKNNQSKIKICSCNLFVRLQEVNATVISSIDYIDRYRQFLLLDSNYACIEDNKILLDQIKKFADLFMKIKKIIAKTEFYKFTKEYCDTLYLEGISKVLEENGLYQTPYTTRLSYYEKRSEDLIYEAIKKEYDTPTGENLYRICKSLA